MLFTIKNYPRFHCEFECKGKILLASIPVFTATPTMDFFDIVVVTKKNLLRAKSQIVQGNEKTVHNGKLELKVDFGSVIIFNTSKVK